MIHYTPYPKTKKYPDHLPKRKLLVKLKKGMERKSNTKEKGALLNNNNLKQSSDKGSILLLFVLQNFMNQSIQFQT